MSDFQDPDLDINIDLNMDESKMEKAHKQLSAIESIWNKLSSLPTIDFNSKIRQGKITPQSRAQYGIFSANDFTQVNSQADSVKKLSYSWDALFNQEMQLLQNKDKQEKTLNAIASSVSDKRKVSAGKIGPLFTAGEGGFVRQNKAVAQTAYGLAGLLNVSGDKDRFVVGGLLHNMWEGGKEGNSFTNPRYGSFAGKLSSFDNKLLKNADWLMSRPYAQDYVKWNGNEVDSIDIEGVRKEAITRKEAKLDRKTGLLIPFEEQEKNTKSAKKWENSWHSVKTTAGQLLDILKAIGGLGLSALMIGIKETSAGAAQMTGGLGMFTGTSNAEILSNSLREAKTWGKATGSIDKAVVSLAAKRGQFKLTGAGDLLPLAMAGTIEGLMTGDKPMQEVYGTIIDMFTQQVMGTKSQGQKDKLLALVQSNLGPEAAALVNTQATLGQNWAQLGDRTSPANGFLDWTKQVMEVNAQMQTSINGIKDTWRGLFITFMELFGNPFLDWLDKAFRKLGVDFNDTMSQKKAEQSYMGIYNSLTPEQRRRMMEGSLLGKYDKTRALAEKGFSQEMGLAENVSAAEINALRVSEGLQPFNTLNFKTGSATITGYSDKVKLSRARAIAAKYGVAVAPSDSFYDIKRKVEEAGLAAVGGKTFGMEVPGINSLPMATAENWTMFNTPENRKKFPKAFGMMDQFPSLTDTGRTANAFDSVMQGIMDGLSTGVFSEQMVLPALQNYLDVIESQKKKESDKVSMGGAPMINMNFSLPNGSDPNAVRQGILDASRGLPQVIENAYQAMYAGGYG